MLKLKEIYFIIFNAVPSAYKNVTFVKIRPMYVENHIITQKRKYDMKVK